MARRTRGTGLIRADAVIGRLSQIMGILGVFVIDKKSSLPIASRGFAWGHCQQSLHPSQRGGRLSYNKQGNALTLGPSTVVPHYLLADNRYYTEYAI